MPELVIADEDVQELVREVIAEQFAADSPHGPWPAGKRVVAVFRLDKWEQKGRTVKGKYQKLNDLTKALSDPDLWDEDGDEMHPHAAVILNQEVWKGYAVGPPGKEAETAELCLRRRKALIHHELCYEFAKADIEEFLDVIQEHGLWTPALKSLGATVATQLELPLGVGPQASPDARAARRAKLLALFSSLGFDEDAMETLVDGVEEIDVQTDVLDVRKREARGRAEAALDAAFEAAGVAESARKLADEAHASGVIVTLETPHDGRKVILGDPDANAARTAEERAQAAADPEENEPFDEEGTAP